MPSAAFPLHCAVAKHDVEEVKRLLASGHDPNGLDDRGEPPIWYLFNMVVGFTLEPEMEQTLWALLLEGADVNFKDVGRRLVEDAYRAVSSALENNEAKRFSAFIAAAGVRLP